MNTRSSFVSALALFVGGSLIWANAAPCQADTGDVFFSAPDKQIFLDPNSQQDVESFVDVFFHVEGLSSVPATGFGMIVRIDSGVGATGSVEFNPPAIVNNQPNLEPTTENPFVDFDRDFGGKSYGAVGASAIELSAASVYQAPSGGPPPALDSNGNLTLPDGSGLASLPITVSQDASGDFTVSFDLDPVTTGVIYSTGNPSPNDVGVHPVGTHVVGTLTITSWAAG